MILEIEQKNRRVASEPTKGTRPKGLNEEENLCIREELLTSKKDRSDLFIINNMIINDLVKIRKKGRVKVQNLYKTTQPIPLSSNSLLSHPKCHT